MEHEDPDREQRDSSFDNDPDAERKMDERFAEMAAHAGEPDPRATDAVNRIMASKFAAPVAAAAAATMLRRPRLATQFFRQASSPAVTSRYSRFSEARRGFSSRVEGEFQQPDTGASIGMDLVKWVFMTSVGTTVGNLGDQTIRATGNYILQTMKETSDEEVSKWPTGPDFLAQLRKAPALGDDGDTVDPVVEANLRAMYKAWYGQKESDFWAGYAQLVGSTSLPLDGQFVALSLMSHMLPPSEMYYWQSQDDALALLEACTQAVKDAGGKASAIYTCLAQHVDALNLPRSIAADLAQMVVSTLVHPPAPGIAADSAGQRLGDPPVTDAIFAFLENVSFMIPKIGEVQMGPLVAGTLSFLQIMFPTRHEDALALVNAFVKAIGQLLDLHDIKDMRDDINHLTTTYLGLAKALEEYHRLNQKNMPQAELKQPGTTVYDTFMAPLVGECVETGKLSGIVDKLINDERYKMDYIPLAMMAACLWIAYNGLYMQMCSYRDGQVSDDAALPYATVLDFIRASAPALSANAGAFKAARLQHLSQVKESFVEGGGGAVANYSIDDSAGSDAIPPGMGHYEEGEINPDALAHVSSKRHEWLASINSTLNEWASTAVDSPIKLWWANFVYQNSPYFFSTPPSAPQVVPGTRQELTQGPVFEKWLACDTVTYAVTFKTDRGEGPRMESDPYKVEKGEVWVPDFPKDRPPPIIWPIPGHPEMFSKRAGTVLNALPDLNVPVDDTNPATVRLVYIRYGNSSDWEPVPAANARLAQDSKATRVPTQ